MLATIVVAGFSARAALIWLGRPEFVGWFNHGPYYWVQVDGLLRTGTLPYADLPFLFSLYGGVARGLQLVGLDRSSAIVHATRGVMCIVPALVALPAYGLVRGVTGKRSLAPREWILVALSAFFPLTLAYMPELLQKNCLGALLLAVLMLAAYRVLCTRGTGALLIGLATFALIALTHLGTLAAAVLFVLSLALAVVLERASWRRGLGWSLVLVAIAAAGVFAVYRLDADAFERVARYARSSVPHSLLGQLFVADPPRSRVLTLLGILAPLAGLAALLRLHRLRRAELDEADRIFRLASLLFAYLLLFPLFDLDLTPRFILFLPAPALVLLGYAVRLDARGRSGTVLIALASIGTATLSLGDAMGAARGAADAPAIQREFVELRERHHLTTRDLVVTRYGVVPICNWFLGTKSGLITTVREDDLRSYDRLFVLNPRDGGLPGAPTEAGTARDAYEIMRRDVPLPADLEPVVSTEYLTFYEVRDLATTWRFDDRGRWIGTVARRGSRGE